MAPYGLRTLVICLATALCACTRPVPVVEVAGDCGDVYQARICTWARMQGSTVLEIGADVPAASLENAPKEGQMAWPPVALASLKVPEAAQAQTHLNHLTVYWEAMGHPPGPYLTPHFDFHFYTISSAERTAIDCADSSKPSALAAAYSLPDVPVPPEMVKMIGVSTFLGLCVPQMGMHSLPTAELESSALFRGTMVIGYYHGQPIFIEPMLTRAMLLEKQSFDLPIPGIPGLSGAYPHTFRANYDAQKQSYRFVFSGFGPTA